MKYYKLTDKNNRTHGDTTWGENVTYRAKGKGKKLCTKDVIHVYDHPLKAVMFNPIHAKFAEYNLWECKVLGIVANDHLKIGVKQCTTIKQITAPEITINQRIRFAIYCALEVYYEKQFAEWAENWLSGKDRSSQSAWAAWATAGAAEAAAAGAAEAAWATAEAVTRTAWAAATAAEAAWAATGATEAAWATAEAVARTARTAWAAATAAEAAAWAADINFVALIKKAIKEEG